MTLTFIKPWAEVISSREVLWQLIRQQLILRYRRTVFGYLWTLLNPILMMAVMAVVFSTLFKQDMKTFTVFLFSGMIAWNCFNTIVVQSGMSFISNEGLIKKIYLPKLIFPLSVSLALVIDSLLSFVALFAIMLVLGGKFSMALLFIPVAYALLIMFSIGIALVVSIATVFFRDLQYVIGIIMQAWFFLTPVFYKPDSLAGKVAWLIKLNPLTSFVELFRAPLYTGMLPASDIILYTFIMAIFSMVVGFFFFSYQEKKIIFRL
ncbi:ABC transporter permease [Sulfuriflexus mobilis]|uniref:ABC transporter permease n=1 Tax=Sulfuriflexus mobilis TaxID=1811807 RepID=UPI00155940AB|nr:ABC transporter permease [Sulfuriflexus mobilis]